PSPNDAVSNAESSDTSTARPGAPPLSTPTNRTGLPRAFSSDDGDARLTRDLLLVVGGEGFGLDCGDEGGAAAAGGAEFGDVFVEGAAGDAEQFRDRGHRFVGPGQQNAGLADLLGCQGGWSAEALAAGAGGGESFVGAFDDEFAHELGQGGEDVEDQVAGGGGGVDGFVQGAESDAVAAEVADDGDQDR